MLPIYRLPGHRGPRQRYRSLLVIDLGPWAGDGPAQELHDGDECSGLLLRSAKSLAARLERKHERPLAAVLAEEI